MLTAQEVQQIERLWYKPGPWNKVYYVNNAHLNAAAAKHTGQFPANPKSTILEALASCVAGDRIIVGPGHVEDVLTQGGLNVTVANIELLGVGEGDQQPTIRVGGVTAAEMFLTADGCWMDNFKFIPNIDSLAVCVDVKGEDCVLNNCRVVNGTAMQVDVAIVLRGIRSKVLGLKAYQPVAGASSCINLVTGPMQEVRNCHIYGDYSTACINNGATNPATVLLVENYLENLNAVDQCINMNTLANGMIVKNACRIATGGEVTWIDGGDCALFENYGVNDDAETGMLIGTPSDAV
jgi:hypothetical protein